MHNKNGNFSNVCKGNLIVLMLDLPIYWLTYFSFSSWSFLHFFFMCGMSFDSQFNFFKASLSQHMFSHFPILNISEKPIHGSGPDGLSILFTHLWRKIFIPVNEFSVFVHQNHYMAFSVTPSGTYDLKHKIYTTIKKLCCCRL